MRIKNLVIRTQMRRRIAVTGQTPAHIERRRLPGQRHVAYRPVAFGAADALRDMDAVVEVDVIRQGVDAGPAQRLALCEALPHRRENFRIGPDLRVAGHAGMGRRDARVLGNLDRRVAVTAIEAQAADVMLMAERYRLRRGVPFLAVVAHHRHDPDEDQKKRHATCRREQGDVHEQVGSRAKYRHQMLRKPTLRSTRSKRPWFPSIRSICSAQPRPWWSARRY